ncbi:MAG: 30S ribosome-binding factor RbfA [Ahrensia sp.]|nr:30S ribosome-binding factor RbfA [Ahrensia sp.]
MASKGPSQRQLRVGELVRHALTEVLSRETLADPALDGKLVSISEVRMSPDLKIATCFVSLLGGGDIEPVVKALAANAKFLRGRAAPLLNQMKFMPGFRFRPDTSFDNFSRIDQLLRSPQVARDLDSE